MSCPSHTKCWSLILAYVHHVSTYMLVFFFLTFGGPLPSFWYSFLEYQKSEMDQKLLKEGPEVEENSLWPSSESMSILEVSDRENGNL